MEAEGDVILKAEGLSVAYGRRTVLRDVTAEVKRGQFWFLLGANGEGKTTLLRCVLGLLKPQSGKLWLSPALSGNRHMGFVPQRCDLNPTLPTTVREFVLLGLVGIRCGRKERQERLAWALAKVGLAGKGDDDYWSLSGGQRQRALVARGLVRRPLLLILDEPTNGLDLPTEESLLGFLSDLNQTDHLTILFVTHDLAVAARYGSHVALFKGGHVTSGPSAEILQDNMLERAYGVPVHVGRTAGGAALIQLGTPPEHPQ